MLLLVTIVISFAAVGFGAAAVWMGLRTVALERRLQEAAGGRDAAEAQRGERERALEEARRRVAELEKRLSEAELESEQRARWLGHQHEEITWLRAEFEKRPKLTRKTYKIITVGVRSTGKTCLTAKWANPLIDLGALSGTKFERYERTVSHVAMKDVTTEHVFEIRDWGGEHIVDALQELMTDEIHGMLLVVDLGDQSAKAVEPDRVRQQLRQFQPEALKFFFSSKTVTSCKTVVLFINKSDLLPGTPLEVEQKAKELYGPLINDLMKYSAKVDIHVSVGSASYGHGAHLLFSHFVEKILPKSAYDDQLLQRLKGDAPGARPAPKALPASPKALPQAPAEPALVASPPRAADFTAELSQPVIQAKA
jgi:hypothetical protein